MLNKSLSDPELIVAIINNDQKAFNELFDRHWERVYAIAFRYVKDEELSLEITHDIFLNIWSKRHHLHINSFKSYVATAASYHGLRKRQTIKAIPLNYMEDLGSTENGAHATNLGVTTNEGETHISQLELDQKVDELLAQLPKRCREIYLLSRRDELSITEIAAQLDISKRTVENQLTIALRHLRSSLQYTAIFFLLFHR